MSLPIRIEQQEEVAASCDATECEFNVRAQQNNQPTSCHFFVTGRRREILCREIDHMIEIASGSKRTNQQQ
jgi:hypothetical protein